MQPSKKILLLLLAMGFILVGSLYCGMWTWLMNDGFLGFTAKQQEDFQLWRTEKLTFPEEVVAAEPFAEPTLDAAGLFLEAWEEHQTAAEQVERLYQQSTYSIETGSLTAAEKEALATQWSAIEPLLTAFHEMVRQDDYTVNVLIPLQKQPGPSYDLAAYRPAITLSRQLLALRNEKLFQEDRIAEALANAESIMLASRTERYSPLIVSMISILDFSKGVESWRQAVDHCDDPELLRQTLQRQHELAPATGFVTRDIPPEMLDQLGLIRIAQREGFEVEIQGLNGSELLGEGMMAEEFLNKDKAYPSIDQAMLKGLTPRSTSLFARLAANYSLPVLYRISLTPSAEFYANDDEARVKFDLLRLYTAQKLYRLEQGEEPKSMADLVPDYLPEILVDIFSKSGQPYLFNGLAPIPFFYSIGRDGIDQQGAQQYRANTGVAAGDIFFNPPSPKIDK